MVLSCRWNLPLWLVLHGHMRGGVTHIDASGGMIHGNTTSRGLETRVDNDSRICVLHGNHPSVYFLVRGWLSNFIITVYLRSNPSQIHVSILTPRFTVSTNRSALVCAGIILKKLKLQTPI